MIDEKTFYLKQKKFKAMCSEILPLLEQISAVVKTYEEKSGIHIGILGNGMFSLRTRDENWRMEKQSKEANPELLYTIKEKLKEENWDWHERNDESQEDELFLSEEKLRPIKKPY